VAAKRRSTPRARAAAAPAPPPGLALPRTLVRFAPSGRSILVGFALLALGLLAYAGARQTSVFAVTRIELAGAPGSVGGQVRRAVGGFHGVSLVALDGADLIRRIEDVPSVYSASYDRAFPHTLRIRVHAEEPVAVLRRGPDSWLVSARGRVVERLRPRARLELPRIWVPAATQVELGQTLGPTAGGVAARALAPLVRTHFPVRVATVTLVRGELAFALRSGVELRLGSPDDVRLKLAIARRIVTALPPGTQYVDVSVPARPVAGTNPQVSSGG
jgi:cell division protein FtsQ